jgi:hypothetical protein
LSDPFERERTIKFECGIYLYTKTHEKPPGKNYFHSWWFHLAPRTGFGTNLPGDCFGASREPTNHAADKQERADSKPNEGTERMFSFSSRKVIHSNGKNNDT